MTIKGVYRGIQGYVGISRGYRAEGFPKKHYGSHRGM